MCKPIGTWDDFLGMSKEHMEKYYKTGHGLMGKDLKAAIEETMSEYYSEKEMEAWIKDGKFLDKEDMEEKFKAKPHQLKSILANTKTHYCNVRDVLLYEDPEFVSQKKSTKESGKDSKRQISSDKNLKAVKVQKIPEEGGEPEALSAGQIKMLTKEAAALAEGTQNNSQGPPGGSRPGRHCRSDCSTCVAEAQPGHCKYGCPTHIDRAGCGE